MPGGGRAKPPHNCDGSEANLYMKQRKKTIEENAMKMRELGFTTKATYIEKSKKKNVESVVDGTNDIEVHPDQGSNNVVRRSLWNAVEDRDDESNNGGDDQMGEDSTDRDVACKKRGQSRGLEFVKKVNRNEHVEVVIPADRMRICRENAQDMITEIGIVARQYSPLDVTGWKKIPAEVKEHMWLLIKDKFDITDGDEVAREVVFKQLANQYRSWRYRLHDQYYNLCANVEEAKKKNKPPDVDLEQWKSLCSQFDDEKFKARSAINKANRSKQTSSTHGSGSMGFARREYLLTDKETSTRPSMSQLWKQTHWSKTKDDWVNEHSKEVYDKAIERIDSLKLEGKIVDENEVFSEILGHHGSYIRGRGRGLKQTDNMKLVIEPKDKEIVVLKQQHKIEISTLKKEAKEAVEEVRAEMNAKQIETDNKMALLMEMVTNIKEKAPVTTKKRK